MANNPECQKKMQEEIYDVAGKYLPMSTEAVSFQKYFSYIHTYIGIFFLSMLSEVQKNALKFSRTYGEMVIFQNNGITIGAYSNAIQKFYTLLLREFRHTFDQVGVSKLWMTVSAKVYLFVSSRSRSI